MNNWKQIYKLVAISVPLLMGSQQALAYENEEAEAVISAESIKTIFLPNYLERYKATNLWFNTMNAAGLNDREQANYTNIEAGYKYTKGDFRMRQDGKIKSGMLLNAEGTTRFFGGHLWGKFGVETENKKDAQFNASIIDPFRGNPFIIADERASKWNLQYYNLAMKVSTRKIADQIHLGIGVNYKVSTGAKQLDPRPKNYFYEIDLAPSMIWEIDNNNTLGGTFIFANRRETSEINIKSDESFSIYKLEGLSAFTAFRTTSGATREYGGSTTGMELQYGWHKKDTRFVVSGSYRYSQEDVIDGTSQKVNTSMTQTELYHAKAEFVKRGDDLIHKASAGMMIDQIRGIFYDKKKNPNDPVESLELYKKTRSTYDHQNVYVSYDVFNSRWLRNSWSAGGKLNYYSQKDVYKLPQQGVANSTQNIKRYDINAHGSYAILLKKGHDTSRYIKIGADVTYSKAGNCDLNYRGPEAKHMLVTDLLMVDYKHLSSDYWKLGGEAMFAFPLKVSGTQTLSYVKANGYYIPKVDERQRGQLMLSLGFML